MPTFVHLLTRAERACHQGVGWDPKEASRQRHSRGHPTRPCLEDSHTPLGLRARVELQFMLCAGERHPPACRTFGSQEIKKNSTI